MNDGIAEKMMHDGLIRFGKMMTIGSILIEGNIISIDESKFTCVVGIKTGDTVTNYNNVPLKVLIGSQASLIEIPTVGTDCTMCFRDNNIQRPQLMQVNQCDKVIVTIGKSIFYVDETGFKLNNDTKGLKKTLQDLINELINFLVVTPAGQGTTDPTTVANLNTYLSDLDDYLLD
jgi:hypothetical protein